jgi:hypothetical protein
VRHLNSLRERISLRLIGKEGQVADIEADDVLWTLIPVKMDGAHAAAHPLDRPDLPMIPDSRQIDPDALSVAYIFQPHNLLQSLCLRGISLVAEQASASMQLVSPPLQIVGLRI